MGCVACRRLPAGFFLLLPEFEQPEALRSVKMHSKRKEVPNDDLYEDRCGAGYAAEE